MTEAKEFKMFKPEDLEINLYPRAKKHEISIGLPNGFEVIHKPTGTTVVCNKFRSPLMNKNWCLMELERKLTPLKTQTCPHCGHVMGYLEGVDFMFCHRCTKKYEVVK